MKITISKKIGCIVLSALMTASVLLSNLVDIVPDAVNTVHADSVHTDHEGEDKDGSCHVGWKGVSSLPTEPGNYYLTTDVTITATWSVPEGTTNLCLNGHDIIKSSKGSAIYIYSGAILNLYNESKNSGTISHSKDSSNIPIEGRGVDVEGGTFNMYGGSISGNKTIFSGGGIYLNFGEVTITGGEIYENEAYEGGGVYVQYGTATISGGEISSNKATGEYGQGGGVYLFKGTVTFSDGTISENESVLNGGGVFVKDGTVTFSGGEISNNKVTGENGNGGGVSSSGTIVISGGTISGNTANNGRGGGVYIARPGTFTMTGGTITNNQALGKENEGKGYGGGVCIKSGTFDMSGGTVTGNTAATDGNNVYIRDDYAAINPGDDAVIDGGLYSEDYTTVCFYSNVNGDDTDEMTSQIIKKGEYVPLKLNEFTREGYDFNGWNTKADGSGEVYADGASVYVDKSVYEDLNLYALWAEPHQDHDKQDDSTCSLHKGWIAWTETETLPNEPGYYFLTKDVMLAEIWMAPPAVTHLCLNGHKIIQSADESAVIYVSSDATLYLYDLTENSGVITHLKDDDGVRTGEGVLVEGGIFNMNGGSISGNEAVYAGGGIYVNGGEVTVSGGKITDNKASGDCAGGGIYLDGGELTISDGVISGNEAGTNGGGICVNEGTLNMAGGTVTGNTSKSDGNNVYIAEDNVFNPDPIEKPAIDGGLYSEDYTTVCFNANGGDGEMRSQIIPKNTETALRKNTFTREDYVCTGWNTKADGTGDPYADEAKVNVSSNEGLILYAQWVPAKYKITFIDNDGTTLQSGDVAYNVIPEYTGTKTPSKAADAQNTYIFAGWTDGTNIYGLTVDLPAAEAVVTYSPVFSSAVNEYEVEFVNEDGAELQSGQVAYGEVPEYKGTTPAKAPDAQYTYTFTGWKNGDSEYDKDAALPKVTGDVTYTAVYTGTLNQYTITFVDDDGAVLSSEKYDYGTAAAAIVKPTDPSKKADAQYTYKFSGWTPVIEAVTGDATYTAQFSSTVNEYTVTFISEGNVISSESYPYGTSADTITPEDPTKAPTAQYTYKFEGWDKEITDVTGDATYTAQFSSTVNEYTVTFISDGKVISATDYPYGTAAADITVPDDPTKAPTAQYTYKFEGWDKEIAEVTGDATYTAQFSSTVNEYTVTFVSEDKTISTKSYPYGTVAADIEKPADPKKAPTAQYTYKFEGWTPAIEAVTGDATYTAQFSSTVNEYTVTFVSEGKTISTKSYPYGTAAADIVKPADPSKEATAEFTYKFERWTPAIADVTGDATYTAVFSSTVNEYTITFVNEGEVISTKSYPYGTAASAITVPADPSKEATAQYTYVFAGWTPEIATVTKDATYTATYKSTVNEYTITFVDADGTILKSSKVPYGEMPEYSGKIPVKEADVQYTYSFSGWTPEIATVTKDATYIAEFSSTVNEYTVTFVSEGKTISTKSYPYGTAAADIVKPADPSKEATAEFTYKFEGWTPAIADVTGDATYTAVFSSTVNEYTITFVNEGEVISAKSYPYGTAASAITVPADPSKEATAQYTYVFAGWTPEIATVTKDATYTATYKSTVNEYTIKFVDEDGTVLQTSKVAYGETPAYAGETPTKESTDEATFVFFGWNDGTVTYSTSDTLPKVTGDAVYTAVFADTTKEYEITFVDDEENVLQTIMVLYGEVPAYSGKVPTKEATAQYTYTFSGWNDGKNTYGVSDKLPAVTGDVTYKAVFESTVNEYTIKFVDEDGTVLQSGKVAYGDMPEYSGEAPVKEADVQYTYSFAGWTPEIVSVTGDAAYTAVFSSTVNEYTVTFISDGKVISSKAYPYGTEASDIVVPEDPTIAPTVEFTYTFEGWTPEIADVTGDATYTAEFSSKVNEYTVSFVDEDGTELQSVKVPYGQTPAYTGENPTKDSTDKATFAFVGWTDGTITYSTTDTLPKVTGDVVYTAVYADINKEYKITFVDEEGNVLQTIMVLYGNVPAYTGNVPSKEATAQYTYTFIGWNDGKNTYGVSDNLPSVIGDATYTATFKATVNEYTITFVNEDGTVLQTGKVAYGETPAFTGTTPSKNATAQYTYTFSGWTPEITKVTADATYTATYKATVNKYEIKFVDDTGRVLSSKEYEYGTKAEDIVKPADPVKASTAQYSYTFEGWTPAIADVTGDATYTAVFIAIAKPASYYLKSLTGDGLGGDIVAVFGRTIDDANAINYLDRAEADGQVLTRDKDYTAEAGSVIITLKKEYLDTISEGKHTLTVYFKDGMNVTLEFNVKHISNESENIPSTGEQIAKTLFIGGACVLLAVAAAGTAIVIKRKRKKEDA